MPGFRRSRGLGNDLDAVTGDAVVVPAGIMEPAHDRDDRADFAGGGRLAELIEAGDLVEFGVLRWGLPSWQHWAGG